MPNGTIEIISLIIQSLLFCIQIPTLIALIFYVIKTWEMASATRESSKIAAQTLQEMKDARDQEIAPYMIAYFDVKVDGNLIEFVIKNIGKSIATNVTIAFDPPFQAPPRFPNAPAAEESMEILMPSGKIPSIPPDHEIRTIVSSFTDYMTGRLPERYEISVTYHGGLSNEPKKVKSISDIQMYSGVTFFPKTQD